MSLSVSLLDVQFVGLLLVLGVARVWWPQRQGVAFSALSYALLIGVASPPTAAFITGIVLLYLFPMHRLLGVMAAKGSSPRHRGALLSVAVTGLVVLFLATKFVRPPIELWQGSWLATQVLSVVGLSYFLFRAIGFLHLQSILPLHQRRPWALLCYGLFPPTLTSGPIQAFPDFLKQIEAPAPLSRALVVSATYRITRGYFRKAVLGYLLYAGVEHLLAGDTLNMLSSAAIMICLYLFFYVDFAGYSDIAIGFGLLMGIKVPENFRKPFLATTVSEFWRNWHITLVDWFRNHVFIPLGGMQGSRLKAASLAFLVMVLCGLWHGLGVSFLCWGVWHGAALFLEAVTGVKPVPPASRHGFGYWIRVAATNAKVAAGALFFLPDTASLLRVARGFFVW